MAVKSKTALGRVGLNLPIARWTLTPNLPGRCTVRLCEWCLSSLVFLGMLIGRLSLAIVGNK